MITSSHAQSHLKSAMMTGKRVVVSPSLRYMLLLRAYQCNARLPQIWARVGEGRGWWGNGPVKFPRGGGDLSLPKQAYISIVW